MGCISSNSQEKPTLPTFNCKTGILSITVLYGKISSLDKLSLIEPEATLKVSNQKFETRIMKEKNANKRLPDKFDFPINSSYKNYGRSLLIETKSQMKENNSNAIGIGVLDLD